MGAYPPGRPVHIVDGARTPFLKARGIPGPFGASDLAVAAGKALLARQTFGPGDLDEVILGCILPGAHEANIARLVALRLGCGKAVPAWTVQRNCGSGMQAIDAAALDIACGRADLVLAGGTEAMSRSPVLVGDGMVRILADLARARGPWAKAKVAARLRPAHFRPVSGLALLLTDPLSGLSMGQTAELLATRFGLTRERMDAFALESHRRLARAQDGGRLEELAPLAGDDGILRDRDEGLRRDADPAGLARLKPAFQAPHGRVTAGNSAQISDGAACLLLASEPAMRRHGLTSLGRIVDGHWAALEPSQMGLGPVHAMAPLLRRRGLGTGDVDFWEINEAFAAQVLACQEAWADEPYCREELGTPPFAPIDPERLNVDGGGIALGHPVGCSGARIVLHLLHVLRRTGARRGMASLCIGGGQGGALLLERD
ncbi:acetyl-CoA C-acetyltransferase [Mesoterricola silvestris]|uniref:Acetyl-CoA acetyltransferase n=1 Tax=Mesoterricola silvestris TaxID=2927979 RepID=A0AA48GQV1_9BACT|nr:acetyl-CoA C-acetyltransferase [Mesoterricola silvestris]BDU74035.1 acetyl-CoA acetyltransferase [Mesoterricola silvestris]